MTPVIYVKVPRASAADWWHQPWSDVLAAAERGEHGLSVQEPKFTPMRSEPPRRESYTDLNGNVDMTRYEQAVEIYTSEMNHAFLREGDDRWTRGKTLLYQQNW